MFLQKQKKKKKMCLYYFKMLYEAYDSIFFWNVNYAQSQRDFKTEAAMHFLIKKY